MQDPSSQVNGGVAAGNMTQTMVLEASAPDDVTQGSSDKYLLVSFPAIRQIAYCKLPDNVWFPLVIGDVGEPSALAVALQSSRFFVSDPQNRVIWWYTLKVVEHGMLSTRGARHAAVENVTARWMAVDSAGDLYFTGTRGLSSDDTLSVFRQDAQNLADGNSWDFVKVYTRSNTGVANPTVWVPSGLAVDASYVYWGNEEGGDSHGSVVKATRTNIGLFPEEQRVAVLSHAVANVSGMAATGTHIFYTSPQGVHGVVKDAATPVSDATLGLVAPPLSADGSWNPTNIAWDGHGSLYFTETSTGTVYRVPSLNVNQQALTKFADAPGVYGIVAIAFEKGGWDTY